MCAVKLVKTPGVVQEVGQDAGQEASREEVGTPQEEAGEARVEGVGQGPPGCGVEEGEEEGLEQDPPGAKPLYQEALHQPAEEDLLRHPGEEGQEEEGRRPHPGLLQGPPQGLVEPFRLPEGGGEEEAEEGLEAPQGQKKPPRPEEVPGPGLPEGQAQEEHPRGPQEEEAYLEGEEEAEGCGHGRALSLGPGP